jgi:2-alkyl-3-oxoalkanoate reductase
MRILITGGTGVIGKRVIPLLLAQGHDVTAIARSPESRRALEYLGATSSIAQLFDGELIRQAVNGHDAVVNLATHMPKGTLRPLLPGAWRETDRIRTDGAAILAAAAQQNGTQRFVQESFAPIYPSSGDQWITEETKPRPARYNRSTLAAEGATARFTQTGGVGIVLRFAFFYGSNDSFTQRLVKSVRHHVLPVFGKPNDYFSMVHHDDAATAVVAALLLPAGVYNVVDDEPLTRQQLGDALAKELGVRQPRILPPWLARLVGGGGRGIGETVARSLRISNHKLRAASGWSPGYPSAREGLAAVMRA